MWPEWLGFWSAERTKSNLARILHPQYEALEKRELLSISRPELKSPAEPISAETIDKYGAALFGQQWQDDLKMSAADVRKVIEENTWKELLAGDDNAFIRQFRGEAQQAGRAVAETWLTSMLEAHELPALSFETLGWFDEPVTEEISLDGPPIMASPMTGTNLLRFSPTLAPFDVDQGTKNLVVNYCIAEEWTVNENFEIALVAVDAEGQTQLVMSHTVQANGQNLTGEQTATFDGETLPFGGDLSLAVVLDSNLDLDDETDRSDNALEYSGSFMDDNGVIVVMGTSDADTVSAEVDGDLLITLNGASTAFPLASATAINIRTLGENDNIFDANTDIAVPLEIDGGEGNDIIYASSDNAIIDGGEGADYLYGGADESATYDLSGADGAEGYNADHLYAGREGFSDILGDYVDTIYGGEDFGDILAHGFEGTTLHVDFTDSETQHSLDFSPGEITHGARTISYSGLDTIRVMLGAAHDTLTIAPTAVSAPRYFTLENLSGDEDTIVINMVATLTVSSPLTFSSGQNLSTYTYSPDDWEIEVIGNDIFDNTLNVVAPFSGPLPHITYNGVAGTDTLNVNTTARTSNQTISIDNATVNLGDSTIDYENVSYLNLTTGAGDDVLDVTSTLASTTLLLNAGAGINRFDVGDDTSTTISKLAGPVNVSSSAGTNRLYVNAGADMSNASFIVAADGITAQDFAVNTVGTLSWVELFTPTTSPISVTGTSAQRTIVNTTSASRTVTLTAAGLGGDFQMLSGTPSTNSFVIDASTVIDANIDIRGGQSTYDKDHLINVISGLKSTYDVSTHRWGQGSFSEVKIIGANHSVYDISIPTVPFVIEAGSLGPTETFNATLSGAAVELSGGPGNDVFNVTFLAETQFLIDGGDGADALTLNDPLGGLGYFSESTNGTSTELGVFTNLEAVRIDQFNPSPFQVSAVDSGDWHLEGGALTGPLPYSLSFLRTGTIELYLQASETFTYQAGQAGVAASQLDAVNLLGDSTNTLRIEGSDTHGDVFELDGAVVRTNGGPLVNLGSVDHLILDGAGGDDVLYVRDLPDWLELEVLNSDGYDRVDLSGNDFSPGSGIMVPDVLYGEHIILSRAGLSNVPDFEGLSDVQQLDLRYNALDLSDPDELAPLTGQAALQKLLLYGNVPVEAPVGTVPDLEALAGMLLRVDLAPVGLEQAEQAGTKAEALSGIAKALHYLPLEIYDYVHNNYQFEAYVGYVKGPLGTIRTHAGNDFDLSQLLLELFSESNTSAQLSFLPFSNAAGAQRGLRVTGQEAKAWLGVSDEGAADEIFDAAYRDNGFDYFKVTNVVTADFPSPHTEFYLPHAWVTATIGGNSVPFDPSWKFRDRSPKVAQFLEDFATTSLGEMVLADHPEYSFSFDALNSNAFLQSSTTLSIVEWFEEKSAEWLVAQAPGYTLSDFVDDGVIRQITSSSAATLTVASNRFWSGATEPVSLSQVAPITTTALAYAWTLDFILEAPQGTEASTTLNVFEVGQSDLTTAWPDANHVALYQDGVELISSFTTFSGSGNSALTIDLRPPMWVGTVPHSGLLLPFIGDVMSLGINAYQVNDRLVTDAQALVNNDARQVLHDNNSLSSWDRQDTAHVTSLAARKYLRDLEKGQNVLHSLFNTTRLHNTFSVIGVFSRTTVRGIYPDLPVPVVPDNLIVNAKLLMLTATSAFGASGAASKASWLDMTSAFSSDLEARIWQQLVSNPSSVGTVSAFMQARQQGITIDRYDAANAPTHLGTAAFTNPLTGSTATELRSATLSFVNGQISFGRTVYVPHQVTIRNGFAGVAILVTDPNNRPGFDWWVVIPAIGQYVRAGVYFAGAFTGEISENSNALSLPNQMTIGGSVNLANGAVINDVVDVSAPNTGIALTYSRHYDSTLPGEAALGKGWYGSYSDKVTVNANGSIDWTNNLGQTIRFNAPSSGNVYQMDSPNLLSGIELSRVMSGGTPIEYVVRDNNGIARVYDAANGGRLKAVKDLHNNRLEVVYHATLPRIEQVVAKDGNNTISGTLQFVYVGAKLDQLVLGDRIWTFNYTPNQLLGAVWAPRDYTTNLQTVIHYEYYEASSYANTPVLNLLSFVRTRTFNFVAEAFSNLAETEFRYYAGGRAFQIVLPDGAVQTFEFDPHRRLSTYVDPRGSRTQYEFDQIGHQLRVIYPDRSSEKDVWVQNQRTEHVDVFGVTSTYTYTTDGLSNLLTETVQAAVSGGEQLGSLMTILHYDRQVDGNGALLFSKVDDIRLPSEVENSRRIVNTYDPATGDLRTSTRTIYTPVGPTGPTTTTVTTTYEYWPNTGLLKQMTDPRGTLSPPTYYTSYQYTPDGRGNVEEIERWVEDGVTVSEHFEYGIRGYLTAYTDGNGNRTDYTNDILGRRTVIEQPLVDGVRPTTTIKYDDRGNIVETQDAEGRISKFQYDGLNRLFYASLADNSPDWSISTSIYDGSGNIIASTDGSGNVTRFLYESRSRLQQLVPADGSSSLAVRWYNGAGQITVDVDARGSTTLNAYNNLGRLIGRQDPLADDAATTGRQWRFEYDAVGNLTAGIEMALDGGAPPELVDGPRTSFAYDSLNRLVRRIDPDPDTTNAIDDIPATLYTYDSVGNLLTADLFGGHYDGSDLVTGSVVRQAGYTYDGLNRLTDELKADGSDWHYNYDGIGNVRFLTDGRGIITEFAYDPLNRLAEMTVDYNDANSNPFDSPKTSYRYDKVGNVTETVIQQLNAAGGDDQWRMIYGYDALNRLTSETHYDVDGETELATSTMFYDPASNLVRTIDPRGYSTHFEYDARNRNTAVIDALGALSTVEYDVLGNVVQAKDQLGRVTTYKYDRLNRLIETVFPRPLGDDSPVETRVYDPLTGDLVTSFLGREGDALQRRTDYVYDELHRVIKIIDPDDGTSPTRRFTESQYDVTGNVVWSKDYLGLITEFTYDGLNRLKTQIDDDPEGAPGDGRKFTFEYDGNGNLKSRLLESSVGAVFEHTKYSYDNANRLDIVERIAVNAVQSYSIGQVYSTTRSEYDAAGNVTKSFDELNNFTEFVYDGLNRLRDVKEFEDSTTPQLLTHIEYAYDTNGNVISSTNRFSDSTLGNYTAADDRTSRFAYDPLNRQTRVYDPLYHVSTSEYDGVGNMTTTVDPLGHETIYEYDDLNRLRFVTDAEQRTTEYRWNTFSENTYVIDPVGLKTEFVRNGLGQITDEIQFDALDEEIYRRTFEYDSAGNRKKEIQRDTDRVREFVFDNFGRETHEKWFEDEILERTIEYVYDVDDRLTSTTDGETTYTYNYVSDPIRRLFSVTTEVVKDPNVSPTDPQTYTHIYSYSKRDEVLKEIVAGFAIGSPYSLQFTYDALGRLTSVGQGPAIGGTMYVSPIGAQFSWNPADELTQIRRYDDFSLEIGAGTQPQPVASTSDYTYDLAGRMVSLVHSGDATPDFRYDFDAAGRVRRQTETTFGTGHKVTQLDYDETSQLTTADHLGASPTEAYVYDDNGNRVAGGQVYDPQNRLVEDATFTYTYDAEGNLASKTRKSPAVADDHLTTYEWDHRNRLISVTQTRNDPLDPQTITIEYAYDMFDRRISKNVLVDGTPATGGFTGFVYSGGQLAFSRTSEGIISDVFLPGALGEILAQDHFPNQTPGDQANQGWLLADYRSSVRYVVNSTYAGAAIDYDSFGQVIGEMTPADAHSLLGYIGQVFDVETGLGYFNARYYDPATGRFISEDPIGFAGGDANLYRYAGNDPVNRTDPSGQSWFHMFLAPIFETVGLGALAGPIGTVASIVTIAYVLYGYIAGDGGSGGEGGGGGGGASGGSGGGGPAEVGAPNLQQSVGSSSLAGPPPSALMLGGVPSGEMRFVPPSGAYQLYMPPIIYGIPQGSEQSSSTRSSTDSRSSTGFWGTAAKLSQLTQSQRPVDPRAGVMPPAPIDYVTGRIRPSFFVHPGLGPQSPLMAGGQLATQAAQVVKPVAEFALGFVPGAGEFLDATVLFGPSSSTTQRAIAGVSLAANLFTAGFLPNFGAPARSVNIAGNTIAGSLDDGIRFGAQRVAPSIGLPSPRSSLLGEARDPRLRDAINNLYRPNATVGSGSSMDALRYERATGHLLSPQGHFEKVLGRRAQLMRMLSDPLLHPNDRVMVKRLLIDIQDALSQ